MLPVRLAVILLTLFSLTFWAAPSSVAQQRQRRVFTNEDFPKAAPPPAPPAPAAAAPAEETTSAEAAPSGVEEPQPDPNLPPILSLSNDLQSTLQRFRTEVIAEFEAEPNLQRQERLQMMMDLTMQMILQNQSFLAELQARQEQAEAEAAEQAQAGAQPAP